MAHNFKNPTPQEIKKRVQKIPDGIWQDCPRCHAKIYEKDILPFKVCKQCGYGFRLTAKERLNLFFDEYQEIDTEMRTKTDNDKYQKKLKNAKDVTGLNEAVVVGLGKISNYKLAFGIMDSHFIMGSMGKVVGDKLVHLFELATQKQLPVIIFCASGGARMQEKITSLMQMARISNVVETHSKANLLYISVLTDPTMGGVSASFAMQADIILAEPKTTIGFAGRRVIEQTIQQTPPQDFQQSETLLKNGLIDGVVKRNKLKDFFQLLLKAHQRGVK